MRILVVDDEREIVDLLTIYLRKENYQVSKAYDGMSALKKLEEHADIKLIILDIMMPKKDGISVLRALREANNHVPVLLLSAKGSDMDKIKGFNLGADDYVSKPFHPLEIMARVKLLLRRYDTQLPTQEDDIQVGPLIIKKESHEVLFSGENIPLTALEFGILHLLASYPNKVFSAEEIFEKVWKQESIVSAKTVMVHVSHLRDKLEEATGGEKIVETVWGVGYKISKN
ncbi:response regulator [Granulicatella sp. zg-ZJ]|uniref:response regulator transcription factor n=1 Tax=unclassified Granulicatella TaxID=2630493 RepID=UPI0013BFEBE6|nr:MULTISPECIES: response regulator transcription factor [unclassified Granulicatella]MBS4749903.1 response regulator transcription factor [Carnobacteriaceae bacterium zg-ZUI78]NEW62099.1 response regulator [Granulicatella sp. zg-ZJ]NEW66394.1 response regulator [Granulicatella sp. zg-84]QMI86140.1 response regulator transcription factor [Carnobacteriaceae bacterium zg-84]